MLNLIESSGVIPDPLIEQIAPGFFSEIHMGKHLEAFKESLRSFSGEQLKSVISCGRAFINRADLLADFQKYENELLVVAGEFDHYRSIEEAKLISSEFDIENRNCSCRTY